MPQPKPGELKSWTLLVNITERPGMAGACSLNVVDSVNPKGGTIPCGSADEAFGIAANLLRNAADEIERRRVRGLLLPSLT